jgi:E3 ubiquitin-protein ligase ZNF598
MQLERGKGKSQSSSRTACPTLILFPPPHYTNYIIGKLGAGTSQSCKPALYLLENPFSTMTDAIPATPTSPRAPQNPRGGRRRGGSQSNQQFHPDGNQRGHGFRGGRGDRGGRFRGRGNQRQGDFIPDAQLRINHERPTGHPTGESSVDGRPDGERSTLGDQTDHLAVEAQGQPAEEGELCFICASTIDHISIAICNHQTCHICALRLRALYKKRDCAYCKVCGTLL